MHDLVLTVKITLFYYFYYIITTILFLNTFFNNQWMNGGGGLFLYNVKQNVNYVACVWENDKRERVRVCVCLFAVKYVGYVTVQYTSIICKAYKYLNLCRISEDIL